MKTIYHENIWKKLKHANKFRSETVEGKHVGLANLNYCFSWKCVFVKRGLWSHYRRDIRKRRNACAHRRGTVPVPVRYPTNLNRYLWSWYCTYVTRLPTFEMPGSGQGPVIGKCFEIVKDCSVPCRRGGGKLSPGSASLGPHSRPGTDSSTENTNTIILITFPTPSADY
jgi:hypothetical protein